MVVRMRIYASEQADHARADQIFYQQVKPVHERHGARFLGRYRDDAGRVVVLWAYADADSLQAIQKAVAQDPETLASKAEREASGLHGLAFEEWILHPTDPAELY
ncbi:MAG: NIPSNAP family protein [Candidatus Sericytochromatia bacterium]|nr:NIPSNAP family protein [Candidatus Sericytochromatia bacterium]